MTLILYPPLSFAREGGISETSWQKSHTLKLGAPEIDQTTMLMRRFGTWMTFRGDR